MTRIEHDTVCATDGAHADAAHGLPACDCYGSLSLTSDPPVDLLLCEDYKQLGRDGPGWPIAGITHKSLYVADRGRLRLVLHVKTGASTDVEALPRPDKSDEENAEWLSDLRVNLGLRAEADRVVLSERGDGIPGRVPRIVFSCTDIIARVGRPDSSLAGMLTPSETVVVKRTYRSICDAPREWRWNGSALVPVTPLSR